MNRLYNRRSDFQINNWIMDSGAFTEISTHGDYRYPVEDYAKQINRWQSCGNLEAAVTQDYMCEKFILDITGKTIPEHQRLTIERYDKLKPLTPVFVLPVLQGYAPDDYRRHLDMYEDRLDYGMRVGVGSVCKRNSNPSAIAAVLEGIKRDRPDLRLHGFGLKLTALANAYITSLLYSADSMAWSYSARKRGGNANGLLEAMEFHDRVNLSGTKPHQLSLVEC